MNKLKFYFILLFIAFSKVYAVEPIVLNTLAQETAPKWIMKQEGSQKLLSGLCVDILNAIEKVDGKITFSWENQFYPLKRMLSQLESNEIQLIVSMAYNKARAKKFLYSVPLYNVYHVAAIRKTDAVDVSTFADIAALGQQGIILTVFGTATSRFLKKQPENLIVDDRGYTPIDNLNKLTNRRGRFFYYYDYGLLYSIKMAGYKDKVSVLPATFRKYQHYIIFSKSIPKATVDTIDKIINSMKADGQMEQIRKKYQ